MNINVGAAQIGQWYMHLDKGEPFLVTGCDEKSRTIETQALDGDLDEIDEETWRSLPLERAEPPEDWTETIDEETWSSLPLRLAEPPEDWTEAVDEVEASEGESSSAPIEKILDER